jgi:gem associated protein 2
MSSQKPCLPVKGGRKRANDDLDDEEGDDDDGLVVELDQFDNVHQLDAAHYLQRVREQARRLPDVFSAPPAVAAAAAASISTPGLIAIRKNGDHAKRKKSRDEFETSVVVKLGSAAFAARYLTSDQTSLRKPPSVRHIPKDGRQWEQQTLDGFARLRTYLDECRLSGVGGKESAHHQPRVPVPAMKDQWAWHVFCVGYDDASGNAGGYFQDDDNDDDDETGTTEEDILEKNTKNVDACWEESLPTAGYTPTVSLLLQLDQVMVRRVLGHLTHYVVTGFAVTGQRAKWIYALLARLECPIHRDDAVTLYSLLKRLTVAREQIKLTDTDTSLTTIPTSNADCLASINLLITIVGIYFEQGGGHANLMEVETL